MILKWAPIWNIIRPVSRSFLRSLLCISIIFCFWGQTNFLKPLFFVVIVWKRTLNIISESLPRPYRNISIYFREQKKFLQSCILQYPFLLWFLSITLRKKTKNSVPDEFSKGILKYFNNFWRTKIFLKISLSHNFKQLLVFY